MTKKSDLTTSYVDYSYYSSVRVTKGQELAAVAALVVERAKRQESRDTAVSRSAR